MKRTILFIIATVLILTLCACGSGKSKVKTAPENETVSVEKCDIDLTGLSTTVAYSQVTNFWKTPMNLWGKELKSEARLM